MRNVGEEGPESHDELDAEPLRVIDHQVRERAPADVRLDPEQQHHVAVEPCRLPVVEGGLGPVDPAGDAVDERDMRSGRLEVEEALGIDVRDLLGSPQLGEVSRCERRGLGTVVPAAKSGDKHRP